MEPLRYVGREDTGTTGTVDEVGVALAPGGVGDLRQDCLDALTGGIEAVIEADRIEADPPVAQMGEHPDGSRGPDPGPVLDQVTHRLFQGLVCRTEVIRTMEAGR